MSKLDCLNTADINAGIQRFHSTKGAYLLDVRTRQEHALGHIPGSINIPLQRIDDAEDELPKAAPLFVYCQSGMRSRQAAVLLREMDFDVCDIGGIEGYRGALESQGD